MQSARNFYIPVFSLAALLLGGCGNISRVNVPRALESSYALASTTSSDSTSTSDPYTCPTEANVVPDYDYKNDGTGRYTACFSKQNKADILIHGIAGGSQLCIFPAQVIDSQHIYVKPDFQAGGMPWVQCIDVTSQGVYASFPDINYNAVFIVESQDRDQMRSCLMGGNYYSCPHYSYGRFR